MSASVPAVTSGNTRVTLSTVIDQLRGRLTTAEIDAVVSAVTPQRQVGVQPGDLITAALFNQMLDDIADLQTRVTTLEGDKGVPVLSGRTPTGDVGLLSLLTIFGTGFDPTPSNNVVQLGGVAIADFVGTQNSTTQLSFQVPNQYPTVPAVVDLTLTRGGRISNALELRLTPQIKRAAGPLLAISRTGVLPMMAVGTTFTLQWIINPQVADTYSFDLLFFDCAGATADAWSATGRISPQSPQPITNATPLLVTATLTAPAGFTRAQVALEVVSSDGTKARTSDPMLFTVNQTPAVTDQRALVTVATTAIASTLASGAPNPLRTARPQVGGVELDGLQLVYGASADVPIDVFVTADATGAGDYLYSASVEGGPWSLPDGSVKPPGNTKVPQSQSRRITVTLTNADTAKSSLVSYLVVTASHLTTTGTVDFTSFARIPIQGVAS